MSRAPCSGPRAGAILQADQPIGSLGLVTWVTYQPISNEGQTTWVDSKLVICGEGDWFNRIGSLLAQTEFSEGVEVV